MPAASRRLIRVQQGEAVLELPAEPIHLPHAEQIEVLKSGEKFLERRALELHAGVAVVTEDFDSRGTGGQGSLAADLLLHRQGKTVFHLLLRRDPQV